MGGRGTNEGALKGLHRRDTEGTLIAAPPRCRMSTYKRRRTSQRRVSLLDRAEASSSKPAMFARHDAPRNLKGRAIAKAVKSRRDHAEREMDAILDEFHYYRTITTPMKLRRAEFEALTTPRRHHVKATKPEASLLSEPNANGEGRRFTWSHPTHGGQLEECWSLLRREETANMPMPVRVMADQIVLPDIKGINIEKARSRKKADLAMRKMIRLNLEQRLLDTCLRMVMYGKNLPKLILI